MMTHLVAKITFLHESVNYDYVNGVFNSIAVSMIAIGQCVGFASFIGKNNSVIFEKNVNNWFCWEVHITLFTRVCRVLGLGRFVPAPVIMMTKVYDAVTAKYVDQTNFTCV